MRSTPLTTPQFDAHNHWLVASNVETDEKRITGMFAGGLIKPNDSLWSALVVLLTKNDDTRRTTAPVRDHAICAVKHSGKL